MELSESRSGRQVRVEVLGRVLAEDGNGKNLMAARCQHGLELQKSDRPIAVDVLEHVAVHDKIEPPLGERAVDVAEVELDPARLRRKMLLEAADADVRGQVSRAERLEQL